MKRVLLATVAAVMTLASVGTTDTLAKTLKLQASSRAGDWAHRFMTDDWAPKLGEMTGGSLEVEVLATKAVVPHRETIAHLEHLGVIGAKGVASRNLFSIHILELT